MAKTINVFKNSNATLPYSNTTEITKLQFVNGKLTGDVTYLTTGKKILGLDHAFNVTNVRFLCEIGKASHAFNIYNGASAAANLLATVRPVASNVAYTPALFDPANSKVESGGSLTFTVSGVSWANLMKGRLEIETSPY